MSVVAKRYAEAYLSVADEKNALDAVGEDIFALKALLAASDDLTSFLNNPLISSDDQKKTLEALFKGKVHSITLDFMQLLIQKERLPDLADIFSKAMEAYRDQKGILPAAVCSAEPLSDDQKSALTKKLAERTGKTIELSETVNPALIGGFQLNLQGFVEDYSLAAKLNTFKQNVLNA